MTAEVDRLREHLDGQFLRVHERIDGLKEDSTRIDKRTGEMQTSCKPCRDMVARHDLELRGSNGEGIKERLKGCEITIQGLGDPANRAKRAHRNSQASVGAAVGAIVITVLNWVFGR